jgi:uncharacterized membrane protein
MDDRRLLLIAVCGVVGALSVPLILKKVRPNPLYGFRTPRTLSNPEIWYPANAFAGWAMLIGAVMSAGVLAVLPESSRPWVPVLVLAVPLGVAVAASVLYSRRLR